MKNAKEDSNPYIDRLKNIFEKVPGVKVVGAIPSGTRASHVQWVQTHEFDVRISIKKDKILYLCSIHKDVAWDHVMSWKEEIRSRSDMWERAEHWEAYSSEYGFMFDVYMKTLLSRMTVAEKRAIDEWKDPALELPPPEDVPF